MKRSDFWKVFFNTLNLWLTILFFISLGCVLIMDLWLLEIPAPFKLFVVIGKLNYGLAISYLAAYIFYLMTVHYESTQNSISVYTAANMPVKHIIVKVSSIFIDMGRKAGLSITEEALSEQVIQDILSKTNCYADSPVAKFPTSHNQPTVYNKWVEYLEDIDKKIKADFISLYPLYSKLDGEYVNALYAVEQNNDLNPLILMISLMLQLHRITNSGIFFNECDDAFFITLYQKTMILKKIHSERNKRYGIRDEE